MPLHVSTLQCESLRCKFPAANDARRYVGLSSPFCCYWLVVRENLGEFLINFKIPSEVMNSMTLIVFSETASTDERIPLEL